MLRLGLRCNVYPEEDLVLFFLSTPVRGAEEDTVENLRFRDTWSLVNSSDFPATTQSQKIFLYSNQLSGKKNHNEEFSKKCNYTIYNLNFTSTITSSSGKFTHL